MGAIRPVRKLRGTLIEIFFFGTWPDSRLFGKNWVKYFIQPMH